MYPKISEFLMFLSANLKFAPSLLLKNADDKIIYLINLTSAVDYAQYSSNYINALQLHN